MNETRVGDLSAPTKTQLRDLPRREQNPRDFLVIEDLFLTKGHCMEGDSRSEAVSIFIVNSGVGKITFNSGAVHIRENSIVQLPTDKLNAVSWEGQSFSISGVSFTSNFIEEMQVMTDLLPSTLTSSSSGSFQTWELSPSERDRVRRQISVLADHAKKTDGPYGKQILAHAFVAFLFDMESLRLNQAGPAYRAASRQEVYVLKFITLVQEKFRTDRVVNDYAVQLNISAKYLTQLVKQYTGKNASELITEQVIKEAKYLLQNPQLSIREIADRLYFSDQSFFGKYFKRQTGISPKYYRGSVFNSSQRPLLRTVNLSS